MKKLLFMIAVAICYLFLASCAAEPAPSVQPLPIPLQEADVPEDASELSSDSVVSTLIVRGIHRSGMSPSVAYVLLSTGNVVVFKGERTKEPFTKEQAKILMLAKVKGKMLSTEN